MKKSIFFKKPKAESNKKFVFIVPLLFFALILNSQNVLGQNRTITGTVVDENSLSLPGTSVIVEGTTTGAMTDFDGKYSINVPGTGNYSLTFSYVGFLTQSIAITNQTVLNITLQSDIAALDEVVVVGYGTQKKESLTAAVAVIDSEEIQTTTNVSVAQKLAGKIAGVQIRQQSGQPGSFDNDINIRGFGAPIYVIDGIRRGGSSDFQQLNADDIESISILKDAAAAIYGLGAANGVILVTTKKGGKSKPSFNYNSVFSYVRPTDIPEMASAAQYAEMWNDTQLFIPGGSGTPFYDEEELAKWQNGTEPGYEGTNWGDEVLKKQASTVQHNFSATGGTEKTNYFVSFGYVSEEGLLQSNDMGYKRYNFRSNLTTELAKNLKASFLVSGRWDKDWQPGSNFFNIFKGTRVTLPTEYPYANNNPDYLAPVLSGLNPVAFMERDVTGYSEGNTRQFTSTFQLEYDVPGVEGLSLKAVAAYDANNYQSKGVSPTYNLYTYDDVEDVYDPIKQRDGNANIRNGNSNSDALTFQAFVNYNKTFNDAHELGATAVIEKNSWKQRQSDITRLYATFYTKDQLRFADVLGQTSDGIENETADFSYVGRINYAYKGKYLVEVAGRYMGSYAYSPENRYGFYPTASLGWRVSEEGFMKNVSWISNMKFRGSYGMAGMPEGDPFQYVPGYSLGSGGSYEFEDGVLTEGISTPPAANGKLSWMEATTSDIGIDLGFFQNRLNFTADIYERLLEGIPARRSIALPNTFGGELPQENLNSEITQGFEFSISYRDMIGKDFKYDVSANFSHSRTKRLHVEGEAYNNSYARWKGLRSGRWDDVTWGYNKIGQFQSVDELRNAPLQNGDRSNALRELPGDYQYEDWNEDGVVDGQDTQPLFYGGRPKMFYGFTLNLSYKGFYANMLLQGAGNYTVRFREVYGEMFAFRGNAPAYFYDRWTKEDPYDVDSAWIPGTWPANRTIGDVGGLYKESSVWRRDASYLRLKTLEFGYNLKSDDLQNALGVTNLRMYVSGFNLHTWADDFVKPFDPEKIEGAFSAGLTYPVTKTFNFGVNINF